VLILLVMAKFFKNTYSCIVSWGERIASGVIAMSIIGIATLLFSQQFWGFFCDRFVPASSADVINTIDAQE